MLILVTGAKGQLGRELVRQGADSGHQLLAMDRTQLDITDPARVQDTVARQGPELVINAAAYTQVDRAEQEPRAAFRANADGPGNLAAVCARTRIPLIHVSTDYVFDGSRDRPYVETDPVAPLGVYGQSKEAGERQIRSVLDRHIIVRTAWVYSAYGHNFVKTMLKLSRRQSVLRVVADQFGSPTSAADLARALLKLAGAIQNRKTANWGTYHYCGRGITTWHGFARKIIDIAKGYGPVTVRKITPVSTAEYPTPARRPAYSVLDCRRIARRFDIHPVPWEQSLERTIDRLMAGEGKESGGWELGKERTSNIERPTSNGE